MWMDEVEANLEHDPDDPWGFTNPDAGQFLRPTSSIWPRVLVVVGFALALIFLAAALR